MPKRPTLTIKQYRRTCASLHKAWLNLNQASETADFFANETILATLSGLKATPDKLRHQVCRRCNHQGYVAVPGTSSITTCRHDDVPHYDVPTGKETPA